MDWSDCLVALSLLATHFRKSGHTRLIRVCFSFSQYFGQAFSLLSPRPHPLPVPFDSPHFLLSSGSFNMALSRANYALKENACTAGYNKITLPVKDTVNPLSHQVLASLNFFNCTQALAPVKIKNRHQLKHF